MKDKPFQLKSWGKLCTESFDVGSQNIRVASWVLFRIMHLHTGNLFDYLASELPFSFCSHLSLEGNRFKYFLLPSVVNQTSMYNLVRFSIII